MVVNSRMFVKRLDSILECWIDFESLLASAVHVRQGNLLINLRLPCTRTAKLNYKTFRQRTGMIVYLHASDCHKQLNCPDLDILYFQVLVHT